MDTTKVLFEWVNVKPDSLPFKPYSPELHPVNIFVEVEIPNRYIKSTDDNRTIITPRGMAYATKKLVRSIQIVQNGDDSDESSS